MSQVSMSGSFSLYMQDSEYLKIQAELDREKNRQLTENEEDAARKNTAANQAILERELKNREAELDLQKSLRLEETDKKEQKQKEVLEAERAKIRKEEDQKENNSSSTAQSAQASRVSSEVNSNETNSVTETEDNKDVTEKADEREDNTKQQMSRFEMLQGHMRSLQSMNSLAAIIMQRINQTSGEIRTDSEEYNYDSNSKSITGKEAARGDLERRKESVDNRAGKTLRDTFKILNNDKTQDAKNSNDERMKRMQQSLSGLNYANTVFSHNVNVVF